MRIQTWQIQKIIQMKMQGYNIYEIEEKTGIPLEEIKQILKIK